MENVIEIRDVSKEFKAFSLDSIDLQIKKGYTTGFIGAIFSIILYLISWLVSQFIYQRQVF